MKNEENLEKKEYITRDIDEIVLPGVVAEISKEEAIEQGIFEEDALTLDDAIAGDELFLAEIRSNK